jgi:hypothetical protein
MAEGETGVSTPDRKLRIYRTSDGTNRVEPPVLALPVLGSGKDWVLKFKTVGKNWTITNIEFPTGGGNFTYDPASQTVVVSRNTPGEYYEYDITLQFVCTAAGGEQVRLVERAKGNSSPGVLVDD